MGSSADAEQGTNAGGPPSIPALRVYELYIVRVPKIDIPGPYTFRFYSNENNEPPHVHVLYDRGAAKVWLEDPPRLAYSKRLAPHRVRAIESLVSEHRTLLLNEWHEHFGTRS